jgi:hypothetical protein
MTLLRKSLLAAAIGAGIVALSPIGASAAVVCSGNVCWHTHEAYDYPPTARVVVHADDWKWDRHDHYRWHEHEGRGYWHGSRWTAW